MQSIYNNSRGAFPLMVMTMSHEQQHEALNLLVICFLHFLWKPFHDRCVHVHFLCFNVVSHLQGSHEPHFLTLIHWKLILILPVRQCFCCFFFLVAAATRSKKCLFIDKIRQNFLLGCWCESSSQYWVTEKGNIFTVFSHGQCHIHTVQ